MHMKTHLSPNSLKSMKKEFEFITQNPLLRQSKRKKGGFVTAGSEQADVEKTIKNLKLQSRLMDFGITQDNNQTIQESLSPSQLSNSRLISQEEFVQRYKDLRRNKQEPMRSMTKNELRDQAQRRQKQFDQKVLDQNKLSPLDKHWTSPFTQAANKLYVSSSVKSVLSGSDSVRQSLYDRTSKNFMSTHVSDQTEQMEREQDVNILVKDIQLNQIVKGYGQFLRTIHDKDKQEFFNYNHDMGNPKFLYHAEKMQRLKNKQMGRLDMVKEWNNLLKREQLKPKLQIKSLKQGVSTYSKSQTTQFQTFLDIQSKRTIPSQQLAGQAQRNQSRLKATPLSQITPLPQLVVRNGSNSSSRKELKHFGFLKQSNDIISDENQTNSDSLISKDVFLTDFPIFWSIIRKEDEIVERLCVCLMNKQNQMTFLKFQLFYQIFIFAEKSLEELNDFMVKFLMKDSDQNAEVSFQDIVGLIELLCAKIDQQLLKIQQRRLADRIYDKIIERIGAPKHIDYQTMKTLVQEQVIPAPLIQRLIYDC